MFTQTFKEKDYNLKDRTQKIFFYSTNNNSYTFESLTCQRIKRNSCLINTFIKLERNFDI